MPSAPGLTIVGRALERLRYRRHMPLVLNVMSLDIVPSMIALAAVVSGIAGFASVQAPDASHAASPGTSFVSR